MRICISSTEQDASANADSRFGRAPYLAFYDTSSQLYGFIANPGPASAHGAGIAAAQAVVNQNANVLITGNLGPNAKAVLDAAGIAVCRTDGRSVSEEVQLYIDGKLSSLDRVSAPHTGLGQQQRGAR